MALHRKDSQNGDPGDVPIEERNMSEWNEDRAALSRRLDYLRRLDQEGKKWARDEWMVEFRRLMDWYGNHRRRRDVRRDRAGGE